ncbi:disease resistance RPP13-like protein 4 [Hibiscus syriacus]|uniref:disease resistance RPP13-like protein 4 n=1 Tax=Hibiscus syriacus TaxID=106335 RepID=UPI001922756C|nr:disease resistance RPP13-like protein 4 [Hibiscus syriacus]
MGGIGKTALARLIYHDPRLIYKDGQDQRRFDKKIWVFILNNFDTIKIAQAIILALKEDNHPDITFAKFMQPSITLQYLLKHIMETMVEIKFMLILDDMWEDNHNYGWEQLHTVLKKGKAGSITVVTTRKLSIAKKMSSDSDCIYDLSIWHEVDCLSIHEQFLLDGKDQLSDEERESLRNISMKAKACLWLRRLWENFC